MPAPERDADVFESSRGCIRCACNVISFFTHVDVKPDQLRAVAAEEGDANRLWRILIDLALVYEAGCPARPKTMLKKLWEEVEAESGSEEIPIEGTRETYWGRAMVPA
jgi:hypothetical protein